VKPWPEASSPVELCGRWPGWISTAAQPLMMLRQFWFYKQTDKELSAPTMSINPFIFYNIPALVG
jgi:hypothetical protein